jgi:hypothetical protein
LQHLHSIELTDSAWCWYNDRLKVDLRQARGDALLFAGETMLVSISTRHCSTKCSVLVSHVVWLMFRKLQYIVNDWSALFFRMLQAISTTSTTRSLLWSGMLLTTVNSNYTADGRRAKRIFRRFSSRLRSTVSSFRLKCSRCMSFQWPKGYSVVNFARPETWRLTIHHRQLIAFINDC